jgi:hypothetical protein
VRSTLGLPFGEGQDLWYGEWGANRYVFTGHGGGGVSMVDVSDPASPFVVSTANTSDHRKGLQSVGHYLYYAEHAPGGTAGGLRIFDFCSGKLSQVGTELAALPCPIDGNELAVRSDGIAVYQYDDEKETWTDETCAGPNEKVLFYWTKDKKDPQMAGSVKPPFPRDPLDFVDLLLSPDGRYLYLALGSSGAMVYDLLVPDAPALIAIIDVGPVYEVALDPRTHLLYASAAPMDDRLYVLDVRDPARPSLLETFVALGARDLWFGGGRLYATTPEAKLVVLGQIHRSYLPLVLR